MCNVSVDLQNVGVCLGFALRSKNEKIKATSIGAMLSQLFGISEPVLFGLLIRYKFKPLYVTLITSVQHFINI